MGANPGNYLWFVLSYNDAGTGRIDVLPLAQAGIGWHQDGVLQLSTTPNVQTPGFDADAPYARQFRAGTIINTLTVLGPLRQETGLTEPRGADSTQVRVLIRRGMRQRWQIHRRVRRAIRHAEREARRQQGLEGLEGKHAST